MRSTRTLGAVTGALLLGLIASLAVGTPAFADTGDATTPPVSVTPTDSAAPAVEAPADLASITDPAPITEPVAAAVEAPTATEAPAIEDPAIEPAPAVAAAAPVRAARSAVAQSAPSASRPGPDENAYTRCWETEVNRTDATQINPYDARTWPAYYTPSEGQPNYVPHATDGSSLDNGEGSDIWTQVPRNAQGNPVLPGGSTGVDILTANCAPQYANLVNVTSAVEALSAGASTGPATSGHTNGGWVGTGDSEQIYWTAQTGQGVRLQTTFTVQFAVRPPVIGFDGVTVSSGDTQSLDYRIDAPETYIDQKPWWQGLVSGASSSCDQEGVVYEPGDTATITCATSALVNDIPWAAWVAGHTAGDNEPASLDLNLSAALTYSTRDPFYGTDWTSQTDHPADSSPWFRGTTTFRFAANPQWLPTAQDKTFRVKAAETLTVTPDGLLTGASWNQGNVGDLETIITNIPEGGTLLPDGTLSFTSEQIGDYGFNFVLQDPATGLRSQDATGAIQVYSDAVIVTPPTPPVAIDPIIPVVELTPAAVVQHAKVLGYTGADVGGAGMLAIAFLITGAGALMFKHRKLRAS